MKSEKWNDIENIDSDFMHLYYGDADWKAHPHEVIEEIDRLLKSLDLEIMQVEGSGDNYMFRIIDPKNSKLLVKEEHLYKE